MGFRIPGTRLWLAVALALSLVAALACGGAEEEVKDDKPAAAAAPAADAPAPTAVPETKAAPTQVPLKKAAEVKATVKPVLAKKDTEMKEAVADFKYVAEPEVSGVYWDYAYTGPRPTKYSESPVFAELVKQGKLPAVEERLPTEVKVVQPPHGIGTYGGTRRMTGTGGASAWLSWAYWDKKNANEVTHLSHVGFFEISDDGRVYTYRFRKGLKWSDGVPLTMEDVRFAWEDVNLNKELHEKPQGQWLDAVTGNIIRFAVVDDEHFTLTWDSPDFILMEGEVRPGSTCTAFYFCFYSPSHYMKQFHVDYADPDELQKMIDEEEVTDWVRLWGQKNNFGKNPGWPWMGHFILDSESDTLWNLSANPYFMEVDPEGNQLPYQEGVQIIKVESREVAIFRTMAGESDFQGANTRLQEIPLYRQNQEKGDFSIKIWPTTGGGDILMTIGMTGNQDAELGKALRTQDFRLAMSIALDREAINDTLYLGLGIPNNWVPHPGVQYYPGDEYAFKDIKYDPDRANKILDGLGYTEKDSAGFRLRTDGSGERLSFDTVSDLGWTGDVATLMVDYWADVGLEFKDKNMQAPYTLSYAGKVSLDIARYMSIYQANPWFASWTACCAIGGGPPFSPDINDQDTGMKKGPDGAIPTEGGYQPRCGCEQSNVWEPKAPAANYVADISGTIEWSGKTWHAGRGYSNLSPERIEMGKQIFRNHADEKYMMSVLSHMGYMRGTILHQNNMINIPETHTSDTWGWYNELFYFTDGKDNMGK